MKVHKEEFKVLEERQRNRECLKTQSQQSVSWRKCKLSDYGPNVKSTNTNKVMDGMKINQYASYEDCFECQSQRNKLKSDNQFIEWFLFITGWDTLRKMLLLTYIKRHIVIMSTNKREF